MPVDLAAKQFPVACFAPPLTDEDIARYEALAASLPNTMGEIRDAMRECLAGVKLWWELPDSKGSRKDQFLEILHRGREVSVKLTSLTPDLIDRLWDAIPWPYELDAMQALFDRTFADRSAHSRELVDACYHLLWHARELCLDREPLTQNKLEE